MNWSFATLDWTHVGFSALLAAAKWLQARRKEKSAVPGNKFKRGFGLKVRDWERCHKS